MSEVVKQAAFEDHLTDLERLIDLKLECQHPDPEAFKAIVEAKIKILAELSILTTESTTLKDIERLANLRILMLHHDIYLKPMYGRFSGFHGNATLVDDTLQRKIKALLDRKAKGSNQDPLDVVKRLTLVEAKLSEQIFSRCFPNKLAEVIKQEMAHLAECMKSPKILPKNIGNANFKTSSIHHVIDKGYFSGAPDLDSVASDRIISNLNATILRKKSSWR